MKRNVEKVLNVCVVGTGMIFQQYHLPVILRNKGIKLCALVDKNIDVVKTLGKQLSVPYHTKIDDISFADLCLVSTPAHVREDIILPLLRKGMHIFCEKPLALNSVKANKMLQAANNSGKKIFVCLNRRFSPNIQLLRKFLKSDFFGNNIEMLFFEGNPFKWKSISEDRAKFNPLDFGIIHDTGSHIIDLIVQFLEDFGVSIDKLIIEKVIFERENLPNDFYGKFRYEGDNRVIQIRVRMSRSVNSRNEIIIHDGHNLISTRSIIDDHIKLSLRTGDFVRIYSDDNPNQSTDIMSTFYEAWQSVLADLAVTSKTKYYTDISAETAISSISLIDNIVIKRKILDLDPYFIKEDNRWY